MSKRGISIIIVMIILLQSVYAQTMNYRYDTLQTIRIHFKNNSDKIDQKYSSNNTAIVSIEDIIGSIEQDSLKQINDIYVEGYASPTGSYQYNLQLSKKRAGSVANMIESLNVIRKAGIVTDIIASGIDYPTFYNTLRENYYYPNREEVLFIVDSDLTDTQKCEQLMKLDSYSWNIIRGKFMHTQRYAEITIVLKKTRITKPLQQIEAEIPVSKAQYYLKPLTHTQEKPKQIKKTIMGLRTNLLLPAANAGVEICLGNRWSLEADYYFPWIKRSSQHKDAFQSLFWGINTRYWLGRNRFYEKRLLGHSVGVGAYAGYYDIEHNYTGHQGEFAAVSIDYLYALPICRGKLHLQFNAGIGYLYSYARPYDVFEPGGKAFREGFTKNTHWVGPIKAAVSVVIPISVTRSNAE